MSADQVRETMEPYVRALQERGDYGSILRRGRSSARSPGTDQAASGAEGSRAADPASSTRWPSTPSRRLVNLVCRRAAARPIEAVFVGTHTGEFAGIPASGNAVRVPYSVLYDVDGDKITALRIYMSLEALIGQIRAGGAGGDPVHPLGR